MENPEQAHFNAAKQILHYLSGTLNYGLQFSSNENQELHTYSNVDWGRDLDTRRSTSGILHKVGDLCIFWTSKLHPVISLSIAESKYIVLSEAAKNIYYLKRLLNELGLSSHGPTQLLSDNQACIKLVSNPIMHSKTKHIDILFHFIREKAKGGEIQVHYIPTTYQQADFLTKPLPYPSFIANRDAAGIKPLPSGLSTTRKKILS
jgi:hypothetical protein